MLPVVVTGHGLLGRAKIDDGQPRVTKSDRGVRPEADVIGTAVSKPLRHDGKELKVDRPPVKPSDADYPAHLVPSTTVPSAMAMNSSARELHDAVSTACRLFAGVPGARPASVSLISAMNSE